jgi:EAL domain-containing protein (putative c-di-GMP-specific phosphodiesterase class I)
VTTRSQSTTEERRSPTPAAVRKRDAIRYLQAALADNVVGIEYQPIVNTDGRPYSAEALLRWHTPGSPAYPLTELILAAERSPVIFRLESWTLTQCCLAAAGWQAALPGLRVSVNLSARHFDRPHLVRRVRDRLREAGLPAAGLALEITETSSICALDVVADLLAGLADLGIDLWLDDFGTGHSSLEWLSRLPLHGIKIPRTFVERVCEERRCEVIVARLIDLAHELGLVVIAEGVEKEEQRAFLAARGCDLIQGFLFLPALPARELPAALARHPRTEDDA